MIESIKKIRKEIKTAPISLKLSTIAVWGTLMAGYPFVFAYIIGYPPLLGIMCFFTLLVLTIFRPGLKNLRIFGGLLVMFVFFLLQFLLRGSSPAINSMVQIMMVGVIVIYIHSFITIKTFIKQYIYFITIIVIFAFIGAVLEFITGAQPLFYYTAHNGKIVAAFLFTVCNSGVDFIAHPIIRSSGIFDEPGTLAFFTMIALLLNVIYFKSSRIEKMLLFLPITTYSAAHILTVVLYVLFFKVKSKKWFIIYVLLAGCLFYGVTLTKDTEYHRIYKITVERFEREDGDFKGNNRSELSNNAKKAFEENPIFGIGANDEGDDSMATNPFTLLAYYGIIGYLIVMYFFWDGLLYCFRMKSTQYKYDCLKCLAILFANFQQRPFGTNIVYFTAILILILCIKRGYKFIQRNV